MKGQKVGRCDEEEEETEECNGDDEGKGMCVMMRGHSNECL